MPGIHVRTFSKFGWIEREKEPALTVPGSYWLCCKQNIYKFTFKLHKAMRAPENFAYNRELMKVVRKIIKLHPRQGQQFCTRHLLVTYNYSSWTRQDKMFAMLKFRDRPEATAYPHAFILTIKVSSPDSKQIPHFERLIKPEPLPILPSTPVGKTSTDSSTRLTPIHLPPPSPKRSSSPLKSSQTPKKFKTASFLGDISLPLVEKYLHEQKDPPEAPPPDEDPQEPTNDVQETVDMPYQYLIEREIEKTRAKIAKTMKINSLSGDKLIEIDEEHKKNYEEHKKHDEDHKKHNNQPQNNEITSSKGKMSPTDPKDIAKSSDITDLVMEGLMFTIRQDKDIVTVVEQKTKLQPDEVLENSEKIEGRTGECLVNSSLLKLENLITKIEIAGGGREERLPFFVNPLDNQKKSLEGNESIQRTSIGLQGDLGNNRQNDEVKKSGILSSSGSSCYSSSLGDDGDRQRTFSGENDAESDERIEEEDIIPEALQNDGNSTSGGFNSRVTSPLMDDERQETPEKSPRSKARIVSSEIVKYDLSLLHSARRCLNYEEEANGVRRDDGEGGEGVKIGAKRQLLPDENPEKDVRINLLKFVNDMTMGVRVVVRRLDIADFSNSGGKLRDSRECL